MDNVLGGIGNTPLVELHRVVPHGSARVIAKLEWANPTGSMKDRMAKAAIERAEADGRLAAGGTVVEYTAGTTGISLAFVCAAKGHAIEVVFSDAFSTEKGRTMRAFGAAFGARGGHLRRYIVRCKRGGGPACRSATGPGSVRGDAYHRLRTPVSEHRRLSARSVERPDPSRDPMRALLDSATVAVAGEGRESRAP